MDLKFRSIPNRAGNTCFLEKVFRFLLEERTQNYHPEIQEDI